MNVMVARDARMSLSNVGTTLPPQQNPKALQLSSDGSLMFERTIKVKEANRGIKITLELLVLENLWSAIRE